MLLLFFLLFWKVWYKMRENCKRWRFALADRGLDYEINLPVTVSVTLILLEIKNPEDHEKSSGSKSYYRSYPVVSYIFSC